MSHPLSVHINSPPARPRGGGGGAQTCSASPPTSKYLWRRISQHQQRLPTTMSCGMRAIKFLSTSPIHDKSRQLSTTTLASSSSTSTVNFLGRPAWVEKELADRIRVPHTFVVHSYMRPTMCQHCKKLLKGIIRQGFQCKDCKFNVHKKCIDKVPYGCAGEAPKEYAENPDGDNGCERNDEDEADNEQDSITSATSTLSLANNNNVGRPGAEAGTSNGNAADDDECQQQINNGNNIPLMRIVQSIKHVKRCGSKIMKSGFVTHWTSTSDTKKTHFWRLDTKAITMFQNETTSNYYKEIPLADIVQIITKRAVHTGESATRHPTTPYTFELKTKNNAIYYVSDDPEIGKAWEIALRQALMPTVYNCETNNNNNSSSNNNNNNQQQANGTTMTTAMVASSTAVAVSASPAPTTTPGGGGGNNGNYARNAAANGGENCDDILQQYQVILQDVLGAGQFGTVYGGVHRNTSRPVAIKVIVKKRFKQTRQEAQLKNEVIILQNISHPGVVNLERMFENNEHIFVVMEKLCDDMLEMIISKPNSRLTERVTKFLIYQILVALKYLHSKNICHCDLKPENVLLATNCEFPQIKLCDFGFARIIGEKSFRRSIVGTPAYLAPEVLNNKKYNRSLDMWSVGVIIYVSLSGTFPFNENEDIQDQITNPHFMYPEDTWQDISPKAINLIGNLLRVEHNKRLSADKTLQHSWIDDYEVFCDLRRLERRVNIRWLTHESDEARWEEYRVRHEQPEPDFGPIISTQATGGGGEEAGNEEENRDKFTTNSSFQRARVYQ